MTNIHLQNVSAMDPPLLVLNKMDQINKELDSDLGMKTTFQSQTKLSILNQLKIVE